ncbi:DoxX family protein [Emticicia sp. TH156]|uniref:DoxX family protein n=1 Tax=Emticicia sp. TH156 TaxID=2067454 RepID=UPI000C781052|nr:DoxX family protein [Emticicia sp. TH156]PLK42475.1 DoxX family protein [Emticicia sp. TH156]
MVNSIKNLNNDLGLLLIRMAAGGLMLFHGIAKIRHGHDFVREMLAEKGLPELLWLGIPLGEFVAPILLIFGLFTRLSGLLMALVMLFVLIFAHGAATFTIGETGGLDGELALVFMLSGMALFFTGGGKYALLKPKNEWLR